LPQAFISSPLQGFHRMFKQLLRADEQIMSSVFRLASASTSL
jgi:hypothetical protein